MDSVVNNLFLKPSTSGILSNDKKKITKDSLNLFNMIKLGVSPKIKNVKLLPLDKVSKMKYGLEPRFKNIKLLPLDKVSKMKYGLEPRFKNIRLLPMIPSPPPQPNFSYRPNIPYEPLRELLSERRKMIIKPIKYNYIISYKYIHAKNHKQYDREIVMELSRRDETDQEWNEYVENYARYEIETELTESYIEDITEYTYTGSSSHSFGSGRSPMGFYLHGKKSHYLFTGDDVNFDRGVGECVPDYINYIKSIDKSKIWKRKIPTNSKLLELLKLKNFSNGVRAQSLINVCEYIGTTMYCIDLDKTFLFKLTPEDLKKKGIVKTNATSLVFLIANDHVYPILNKDLHKSIIECSKNVTVSNTPLIKYKKNDDSDEILYSCTRYDAEYVDIWDCYEYTLNKYNSNIPKKGKKFKKEHILFVYTTKHSIRSIVKYLYHVHGIIPSVKCSNKLITEIFIDSSYFDITIKTDVNEIECNHICNTFSMKYDNKGIGSVVMELFNKFIDSYKCPHIKRHKLQSTFNNVVDDIINKSFKRAKYSIKKESTMKYQYCIDMRTCYSYCLRESKYPFPIFDMTCEPEYFNSSNYSGYYLPHNGIYFVETNDIKLFSKSQWYCREIVEVGLSKGVISPINIIQHIKPIEDIPTTFFTDFYNFLCSYKSLVPTNDSTIMKLIMNTLVGCLNRKNSLAYKVFYSESHNDASWYYTVNKDNVNINKIPIEGKDNFLYEIRKTYMKDVIYMSRRCIYNQIIDISNARLYELINIISPFDKVLGWKTDCVYFESNNLYDNPMDTFGLSDTYYKNELGKSFTKDHVEKSKFRKTELIKQYIEKRIAPFRRSTWNDLKEIDDFDRLSDEIVLMKKGLLVYGLAGVGKSTLVKKIRDRLGDKCMCMSFTNIASLLIGGSTIHKSLGITPESDTIRYSNLKKFDKVDYLLIDEVSTINNHLMLLISVVKRLKNVKIILAGDYGQLPAIQDVEKELDSDSLAIQDLCDFNRLVLKKNRRSDTDGIKMWNIYQDIFDDNKVENNFKKFRWGDSEIFKHLSFTNKDRITTNMICMDMFISKHNPIKIEKFDIPSVEYCKKMSLNPDNLQKLKICSGMPVISIVGNKKYDIYKNDKYTISSVLLDEISLVNNRTNELLSIPKCSFNELFTVAFCITIHKSQGDTYNEPYVIWGWDSYPSYIRKNLRYVACSRTTKLEFVHLG